MHESLKLRQAALRVVQAFDAWQDSGAICADAELLKAVGRLDHAVREGEHLKKPACDTCQDTHQMELEERGKVPCTRCPMPCESCRGDGAAMSRAYCAETPCSCDCHRQEGEPAEGGSRRLQRLQRC